MLAGEQPPLQVAGEAVGAVGRLLEHGHARLPRRVLEALVGMDVAEQEIFSLLDPHRPFRRAELAAEAGSDFLDRLRLVEDTVELRIELLDALGALRGGGAEPPDKGKAAGAGQFEHVST